MLRATMDIAARSISLGDRPHIGGESGRRSRVGPLEQLPQQVGKALLDLVPSSVDSNMIAGPSIVAPRHDLIPRSRDIDDACFNAASMLKLVQTDDFNLDSLFSSTLRGLRQASRVICSGLTESPITV